ncbi:MAG: prolyl oligopeptidase family serine peptidase [Planctomycetota bacterium]
MMRWTAFALLILVAAAGQTEQTFTAGETEIRYLLFLPEGYDADADATWPLILFLHGRGECGTDIEKVKVHGPPKIVESRKDFPFIVVSPQSEDARWNPERLVELLDHVAKTHRVDRQRIYLTGLSMGGYGTWALAAAYPDRFAAIVPICGGGDPGSAEKLKGLPIRAFHGAKDRIVPLSQSQQMVDAIRAAGGDVVFTVYPDAAHDAWTWTYGDPKLFEWLLAQRRPDP